MFYLLIWSLLVLFPSFTSLLLASFLASLCSFLFVPFSSVLLFIPFILLFLVFCLFIPLYSCHLCFLESSFIFLYIFLSFSSHLQSLLSSGLDFKVLFFPHSMSFFVGSFVLDFCFIQREREREEEGESPSSIMKLRWPDRWGTHWPSGNTNIQKRWKL